MKTKLKPCPFCGGSANFVEEGNFYSAKVKCSRCGATAGGSAFKNDEYNAKVWNSRKEEKYKSMWLCESQHLILRPNVLYKFEVKDDCEECCRIRDIHKNL